MLKNVLTGVLVRIFPKWLQDILSLIKEYLFRGYGTRFYAQDGIDAILLKKIPKKDKGFYVDVGANHPFWASNTYAFYKRGWRGINIDAAPGHMGLFRISRRRDINLEVPISNITKPMKFFIFKSSALNSFSEKLSKERMKKNKIKKIVMLKPKTLSQVLQENLPEKQHIDLLTIDVEGHDLNVLKSNNWKKYRPKFIIIEQLCEDLNKVMKTPICLYLKENGYELVASSGMDSIYEDRKA